jgi:hypothetical protein
LSYRVSQLKAPEALQWQTGSSFLKSSANYRKAGKRLSAMGRRRPSLYQLSAMEEALLETKQNNSIKKTACQ